MTEQTQFIHNEESYNEHMIRKYEGQIKYGNLEIGDPDRGAPDVINLRFLEKFNIQTLKLYTNNVTSVKLRNKTIKVLTLGKYRNQFKFYLQVDDLELENLEVLDLADNKLENNQLYNLAKFKKLHSLNISRNNVDLTHIHSVKSLTKLSMQNCEVTDINQISSLVTLKELDLSQNKGIKDISPLCQLKSLTKLNMRQCELKNIDQISLLINLQDLNLSENIGIDISPLCKLKKLIRLLIRECDLINFNKIGLLTNLQVLDSSINILKTIDSIDLLVNLKELTISENQYTKTINITSLKYLTDLIKLNLSGCGLRQLSALKPLINLQTLELSNNYFNNINELQYLKSLTHLNLKNCEIVSIYSLRPLLKLEQLDISYNNIVYLDANIDQMANLKELRVNNNLVSDFSSIEQHPNYNNTNENGFNIYKQKLPSFVQLFDANESRNIESPNIQLKQIQTQRKSFQTMFSNFKQEINAVLNNACQSQIQFTTKIIHIFQYLNQFGFE
ncbi:leucine-rich_repeat domain-containing protein [Hexamita inflata]|uniref:Leucine-rich repeat domain-containing protein n=1 Tax=Hexamita inflata TaxID=28002 RepID=A0AA86RRR7_9EUKA|nr:leucine-rich repeat domain-containing protein [Hexamita inflata]